MINYRDLWKCVACDGKDTLRETLNLGAQPLANAFLETSEQEETYYPLKLNHCETCGHLQLSVAVNPKLLFTDYIYRSGTSDTLRKYFDWFAEWVTKRHHPGRVLDIACNDGSQLDSFKELGWSTFGIDPAANLSMWNKHSHHVGFFDDKADQFGQFDVIIAQNVLAHTADPVGLLATARRMAPIMYVQTSQAHMIENNEFDTIYHEHISFFSPYSMKQLAARAGWHLTGFYVMPIHGGSYVWELRSHGYDIEGLPILSQAKVDKLKKNSETIINNLREAIELSPLLVGYGAAAKGMTVLNAVGVGPEYIVDDAPEKQGMFTPGLKIPVQSPVALMDEERQIDLMPLAWNFHDEITYKVAQYYQRDFRSLQYFPRVVWR